LGKERLGGWGGGAHFAENSELGKEVSVESKKEKGKGSGKTKQGALGFWVSGKGGDWGSRYGEKKEKGSPAVALGGTKTNRIREKKHTERKA